MTIDIDKNSRDLQIDQQIYLRILRSAITQTDEDILAMNAAFAAGDISTIQAISHRWKGDYANLRLDELSRKSKQINEETKLVANPAQIKNLYSEFLILFEDIKKQLN